MVKKTDTPKKPAVKKTAVKKTRAKRITKKPPVKPSFAQTIFDLAKQTNYKVRGEVYANKTMDIKVTKDFVDALTARLEVDAVEGDIVCVGKLCFFYRFFGKQIKITDYREGKIYKEYVL